RSLGRLAYRSRVANERARYAHVEDVHELPPIFHYWTSTYLKPKVEALGFLQVDEFFVQELVRCHERAPAGPRRFVSLGAGTCDTDVRLAKALVERGVRDFVIECMDLNPAMLARGSRLAREAGVAAHVQPLEQDFN